MGWLLSGLFGILGPILKSIGERYFIIGIIITSLLTITVGLATAFNQYLASNVYFYDSNLIYVGVLTPSNLSLCLGLIIDAALLKAGYDFAVNKLMLLK